MIIKDRYKIQDLVAKSPFGDIYNGIDLKTKEQISFRQYTSMLSNQEVIEKMINLIYKLSALNHPCIVRIVDIFQEPNKRLWLIYDTPYEGSLEETVTKIDRFPPETAINIIKEVGKGLEYAHLKGVIHGGLNLKNIWLMSSGKIKIANFAIDHLLNFFMLNKNIILLPTTFMPPEQLKTLTIHKTTDTFALSVVLYKLLSGTNPFPEIKDRSMHLHNLTQGAIPLAESAENIPIYLDEIVLKSLNKNPRLRHNSVTEYMGDLRAKEVTISVEEASQRIEELDKIDYYVKINREKELKKDPLMPERKQPKQMKKGAVSRPPVETPQTKQHTEKEIVLNKKKLLSNLIIAAILFGLIIAIIQALFIGYFTSIPTMYIPNIINKPVGEAREVLSAAGLRSKITAYTFSVSVSPNNIIETNPVPGRLVKRNRLIKLIVSKGLEKKQIPSLEGKTLPQAKAVLDKQELKIEAISYKYDTTIPQNVIIRQWPDAKEVLASGSTVNVMISKGFPITLSLIDDNFVTKKILLTIKIPPDWVAHNIEVSVKDSNGKHTVLKRTLHPDEELVQDYTLESNAFIEVYANKDTVLKQSLSELK